MVLYLKSLKMEFNVFSLDSRYPRSESIYTGSWWKILNARMVYWIFQLLSAKKFPNSHLTTMLTEIILFLTDLQVFISYSRCYYQNSKEGRAAEHYLHGFYCSCVACTENWPTDQELRERLPEFLTQKYVTHCTSDFFPENVFSRKAQLWSFKVRKYD